MINFLTLKEKLAQYRVTNDTDLPWAYQTANPQGRPLHDDWVIYKNLPRIQTAFKVPLPFKQVAGNSKPVRVPILRPELWTFAPDCPVEEDWYSDHLTQSPIKVPWVWTYESVMKPGEWSLQAAWLGPKHGWTECFYTRSVAILGKHKAMCYAGLKLDCNPRDLMAWYPEVSGSIKWNWLG